jgi:hypothetical protein
VPKCLSNGNHNTNSAADHPIRRDFFAQKGHPDNNLKPETRNLKLLRAYETGRLGAKRPVPFLLHTL